MYQVISNERNFLAMHTLSKRVLGGVGAYYHRAWVFPLYTPAGLTVLQEFPFDHPFHNGCFVAQHPVLLHGRETNFWFAPPRRGPTDEGCIHVGRMDTSKAPTWELLDQGVRFHQELIWRDEHEQPVLAETRKVCFWPSEDAIVCDIYSRKTAAHGALEFPQTKYGGIGVRVEPRLLSAFGGSVLADGGRRGRAEVIHEGVSDWVAYENTLPGGGAFGIFLHILDSKFKGPWFIRDYGLALYNPTWRASRRLAQGEFWDLSLRIVAYDKSLSDERAVTWCTARSDAE